MIKPWNAMTIEEKLRFLFDDVALLAHGGRRMAEGALDLTENVEQLHKRVAFLETMLGARES